MYPLQTLCILSMSKPSNDNISNAMDTLALKFVQDVRAAVSEQITLSVQKEILLQIEKANINSRKTSSASPKASSSRANATSPFPNDTLKNDKETSSLESNERSRTDKGNAKDVHSADTDDTNKNDKKKRKKRKRHADDGEETMNRFSCNQQ